MLYYKLSNRTLISLQELRQLEQISEAAAQRDTDTIFALNSLDPAKARRSYCVTDPDLLFVKEENLSLLSKPTINNHDLPAWVLDRIKQRKLTAVNTAYPAWQNILSEAYPSTWKINVVGLGDVGGTLVTGLRMLGQQYVSSIGVFDLDTNKVSRWVFEANQILSPDDGKILPEVKAVSQEDLFDCDMFVFCVTVGVPPLNGTSGDVRMLQLDGNSRLVNYYAKAARDKKFNGIFAVVSDPVDLLCKSAFLASNTNEAGKYDFAGLAADKIRGYGLGVMHARAVYYSKQKSSTQKYASEGRAFGPHGEYLIIADSINNYNDKLSLYLTEKARTANLEVRATGFKPYIAPALSSGAYSILATISGQWHYSATYMGGVYFGARNRFSSAGTEIERYNLHPELIQRLNYTYKQLECFYDGCE